MNNLLQRIAAVRSCQTDKNKQHFAGMSADMQWRSLMNISADLLDKALDLADMCKETTNPELKKLASVYKQAYSSCLAADKVISKEWAKKEKEASDRRKKGMR
jgi:uncharacterized protein (DUF305 family)